MDPSDSSKAPRTNPIGVDTMNNIKSAFVDVYSSIYSCFKNMTPIPYATAILWMVTEIVTTIISHKNIKSSINKDVL